MAWLLTNFTLHSILHFGSAITRGFRADLGRESAAVGTIGKSAATDLRFLPTEKREGWSTFRHRTIPSETRSPVLRSSAPEYAMMHWSQSTPDEFRQQEDRLDQCSGQRRQPHEECSQILCCGLALASIPRLSLGDPLLQYVA